jgi:hypothetical protein
MRPLLKISLALAALAPASVAAQQTNDRTRTIPIDGGFLEIDSRSGGVRECTRVAEGYQCKLASQETLRSALDRLARENAELKERLSQAQPMPAPAPAPRPITPPTVPSDEEVDRALGVMEKFLRRFMGIIREQSPDRT